MGPMGLSAARHAAAKVAYVTGRQELVSPSNSLPKSPASSRLNHKQVSKEELLKIKWACGCKRF